MVYTATLFAVGFIYIESLISLERVCTQNVDTELSNSILLCYV